MRGPANLCVTLVLRLQAGVDEGTRGDVAALRGDVAALRAEVLRLREVVEQLRRVRYLLT